MSQMSLRTHAALCMSVLPMANIAVWTASSLCGTPFAYADIVKPHAVYHDDQSVHFVAAVLYV